MKAAAAIVAAGLLGLVAMSMAGCASTNPGYTICNTPNCATATPTVEP